ncbi:MAG: hypothetical protein ACOYMS_03500 [Terrimicrobiaceae bacterium]
MMNRPFHFILILLAVMAPRFLRADSLEVSGIKSETIGTTAVITGGGSAANTTFWSLGTVGQFIMLSSSGTSYGLEITADSRSGALHVATDSLMVARTVNSQGLTDNGTVSVYVRPTGTNAVLDAPDIPDDISGATSTWTLDLTFSFFEVAPDGLGGYNFTSPYSVDLLLTSLDIDFNQKYFTKDANFTSNMTYTPTSITAASGGPVGYTGFTASGDSTFNNPAFAVSSGGTGSSFSVQISHNSMALYMFEFRDPSEIVPEPGTATLVGMGVLLLLARNRRRS